MCFPEVPARAGEGGREEGREGGREGGKEGGRAYFGDERAEVEAGGFGSDALVRLLDEVGKSHALQGLLG